MGRRIQRAGFKLRDVAAEARVSERMVHYHLTGRKNSPVVADAIARLLSDAA